MGSEAPECDVLLAGTMGSIGPAVRSSLEVHGLKVEIMEFPQNVFRDEFGYWRRLLKAIDACRPAMILPVGNPIALSRIRKKLPSDIIIPVEEEEKLRLLDSKVSCSSLAAELGILQPGMYSSPDETGERQVVFKRDVSFGGHGVHLPWTKESLLNLIAHQPAGEPYLIEDYVEGTDYSADAIRWNGFFRAGCYRTVEHRGNGPSKIRESVCFPELEEILKRILDRLDYRGICGADFRVSPEGEIYFLECNPRFTGGVETQVASGFDIAYLYWRAASGQPIP